MQTGLREKAALIADNMSLLPKSVRQGHVRLDQWLMFAKYTD